MNEWTFRLDLAGLDVDDDEQMDALYEAGCDDATFATDETGPHAVFHRQAPTAEAAVLSAIRSIEGAGAGTRVVRVQTEDEWLTAAELAQRLGRSRQSIGQLITAKRGPGEFPSPVVRRNARNPLWSWEAARAWFAGYDPEAVPPQPQGPSANFLAAVNDRLDERERRRQAPDAPWWPELADVLPLVS